MQEKPLKAKQEQKKYYNMLWMEGEKAQNIVDTNVLLRKNNYKCVLIFTLRYNKC